MLHITVAAEQVIILSQSTLCLVAEKKGRKLIEKKGRKLIAILNMCFHCFKAKEILF